MNTDPELDLWQQQWRQSSPAALDIESLLAKARRRNRSEKLVTALEVLLGLVVIAGCLATAVTPDLHAVERVALFGLAALAGGFILWVFRQRRRNWLHLPTDAQTLVRLERQRLHSRLHYWRVSLWGVTGLWILTLAAVVLSRLSGADNAEAWLASSASVLAVLIATASWALLVRRQVARRQQLLDGLEQTQSAS